MSTQTLPEWFTGEQYVEGAVVRNRFCEKGYELNNIELSMYDFIYPQFKEYMGFTLIIKQDESSEGMPDDLRKGLDWFSENNSEAYITLLHEK